MPKKFDVDDEDIKSGFIDILRKEIQSANLNFLIGSGCSMPAIQVLGNIEKNVQVLMEAGKQDETEEAIFSFIKPFLDVTEKLRSNSDAVKSTLDNYKLFFENISKILLKRKSNILPRRAIVFSTNYDLFSEKAFEEINTSAQMNDGFKRTPVLEGSFRFSSSEFFNSIFNNGNLYNYKAEIPSINLVKLHGSISWQTKNDEIVFSVNYLDNLLKEHDSILKVKTPAAIKEFNRKFNIVLPTKDKFKDTVLNQTYYELLRLYANELEKEITILIVEGFSFADEHILEITKRALKNPTFTLTVFCYSADDSKKYDQMFSSFDNVHIVYSESGRISFTDFNLLIKAAV